jgi:hypothetical protein
MSKQPKGVSFKNPVNNWFYGFSDEKRAATDGTASSGLQLMHSLASVRAVCRQFQVPAAVYPPALRQTD